MVGSKMYQVTIFHTTREAPKVQRLTVLLTVTVVVVLITASVATAQTARYNGLGGAGIALADDAGAVVMNRANLAVLDIGYEDQMKEQRDWEFEAAGTFEVSGDSDFWGVNFVGSPIGRSWGIGAGYDEVTPGTADGEVWTLGFGLSNTEGTWAVGIGVTDLSYSDPAVIIDDRWVDLGVLYRTREANWGLTVEDIGDKLGGPYFNAGVAWMYSPQWTLVADIWDVTDEIDTGYAVGAEFTPRLYWTYRGGFYQGGNFAAGLGYERDRWAVDVAWMEAEGADEVHLSGSIKF
jgi:hypothetical protein